MSFFEDNISRRELPHALVRAVAVVIFIYSIFIGRIEMPSSMLSAFIPIFTGIVIYILASLFVPEENTFMQAVMFLLDAACVIALCAISGGERGPYAYLMPLIVISAAVRFGNAAGLVFMFLVPVGLVAASVLRSDADPVRSAVLWLAASAACYLLFLRLTEISETHKFQTLYMQLEGRNEELERQIRVLEEKISSQTIIDPATGLKNFRYFRIRIGEEMARARRQKYPFSVCLLEVDDLAAFEKMYGAHERDLALQRVAARISEIVRDTDLLGRHLANQFLILFPQADSRQCLIPIMRLRKAFENMTIGPEGRFTITASVGVVCFPDDVQELGGLLALADAALKRSREKGNGMVTLAGSLFRRRIGT